MAVAKAIRMAIVRALVPPTTATPPRAAAVAHHHRHRAGAAAEVAAVIPVETIRAEDSPAVEEGVANQITPHHNIVNTHPTIYKKTITQ